MPLLTKSSNWMLRMLWSGILALLLPEAAMAQQARTVKITPLGSRTGEYCVRDRALLFEDPTGVRILYDPGVTVTGGNDSRLGDVHVILVSHSHYDHMGYQKLTRDPDDPAATCNAPGTVFTADTTTVEIAAAKNSAVLVNDNMGGFLAQKIAKLTGAPPPVCWANRVEGPGPSELIVPRSSPCAGPLAFGTLRTVTRSKGMPGVRINMVAAQHTDGIFNPAGLMTAPFGGYMNQNGMVGYDGLANGFVLTFTNGLKVYLTGDTGPTSDMALIVRDFYHPNLAVVNVDGVNSMGPEEAAYAMKQLVQPAAVIPSHSEEQVTNNGVVSPDSRTAQFIQLLGDIPAYVPLSGKTMEFDGNAGCVAGCGVSSGSQSGPQKR